MGVRHLYSFISKAVPNGLFPVNISDEVKKFQDENPGKKPLIIVDLLAISKKAYTSDHEILLGGRYNIYNERTIQMFTALQSLGARILYFCDGPPQPEKISTCLKRQNEYYANHVKILHAIDDGLDLSGSLEEYKIQGLNPFYQNMIDLANKFGELRMSTLNECDQEIVDVANKERALAIISQDSDFLIFEGEWKYWSANELNFETLNTLEFNKYAMREHLSLSSRQMILLGALSGNDILEYDMVKSYHYRISQRGWKFYKIANEVRGFHSLPPRLSPSDENYILETVFLPKNRSTGLRNLRRSLNLYCCIGMQNNHKDCILESTSKDSKRFCYVILNGQDFIINMVYVDLSKSFFMPYYELIRQIIRRIMGILLHNQQSSQPKRVFYVKRAHERPYERITETPDYPPYERFPQVLELLYRPYGKNQELDRLRLDLFCWQISPNINPIVVLQLPKENLITVITIFYLIEKNQISIEEADCILLACNCPPEVRDTLSYNEVKKIDGRDARLSFLFARMFNWIYNCLAIVGLGSFCSLISFDGLYFHWLRKKCRKEDKKFLQVLLDKYRNLRIYRQEA